MIRLYRYRRWLKRHIVWILGGLVITTCLLVAAYHIYRSIQETIENQEAMEEYALLSEQLTIKTPEGQAFVGENENIGKRNDRPGGGQLQIKEEDFPRLNVDHKTLRSINSDYIGWIYFPAFEISYPVVKERYVDQYLRTTFQGTPATPGTIFMDVISDSGFSGMSNFLFGHNMRDKTMFGKLTSLTKDASPIDDDPFFYIYTKDYIYRYRIFAFYYSPVKGAVYADVQNNDAIYMNVVDYMLENNMYDGYVDIDFDKHPRLLSLSTCQDAGAPGRFIVTGARDYIWYSR